MHCTLPAHSAHLGSQPVKQIIAKGIHSARKVCAGSVAGCAAHCGGGGVAGLDACSRASTEQLQSEKRPDQQDGAAGGRRARKRPPCALTCKENPTSATPTAAADARRVCDRQQASSREGSGPRAGCETRLCACEEAEADRMQKRLWELCKPADRVAGLSALVLPGAARPAPAPALGTPHHNGSKQQCRSLGHEAAARGG